MVDWQEVNAGVGQAAIVLVTGIYTLVVLCVFVFHVLLRAWLGVVASASACVLVPILLRSQGCHVFVSGGVRVSMYLFWPCMCDYILRGMSLMVLEMLLAIVAIAPVLYSIRIRFFRRRTDSSLFWAEASVKYLP